ncbi:hypothetical protein [Metabacillus litoralis]|uniref:hypothetical protein n=1 Tax=Metabacillus litoralis TaxID=152268 RepID=UPI00203F3CE0|nr:hypothetical protein [Metabacillus litoralis]MCM3410095.1 hypothetical protein [Metabacillus litoralis]
MSKLLPLLLMLMTVICFGVWFTLFLVFSEDKKEIAVEEDMAAVVEETPSPAETTTDEPRTEATTIESTERMEPETKEEPATEQPKVEKPKVTKPSEPTKKSSEAPSKTYRLYETFFPDFYEWFDTVLATDVMPPVYEDYELDQYYIQFVEQHFPDVQKKLFSFDRYFQHYGEELPTNGTVVEPDDYQLKEKADELTDITLSGMSEPHTNWVTGELGEAYKNYLGVAERYMYHVRITIDDGMFEPVHTYEYTSFFREDLAEQSNKIQQLLDEAKRKLQEEKSRIDNGQVIFKY